MNGDSGNCSNTPKDYTRDSKELDYVSRRISELRNGIPKFQHEPDIPQNLHIRKSLQQEICTEEARLISIMPKAALDKIFAHTTQPSTSNAKSEDGLPSNVANYHVEIAVHQLILNL
ncbi:MAG: hypothetical protein FDW93_07360 [Bergeyella sp.]|nr:hypothetical protein [Bergeyella sp.]